MKKIISRLVIVFFFFLVSVIVSVAPPPQERTIKGTIYKSAGVQVESGIDVYINDTNTSLTAMTKTYGPPNNRGAYSATLNSSEGDIFYVRAMNATHWGFNTGIMGVTQVTIDVYMNRTRNSESSVVILIPLNHTSYNSTNRLNVTANITILGNDGTFCNATLNFSVPGIFQFNGSDTATHNLGNMGRGSSVITAWNLTAAGDGAANFTVTAKCRSDGINLEGKNSFTVYNLSSLDITAPAIFVSGPINNSRILNPAIFLYNVTDGSPLINCTLSINDIITNVSINPITGRILNFTYLLTQKNNFWEINCTDSAIRRNMGATGLFNLTLNDAPAVSALVIESPIDLMAAGNRTVFCNGTAADGDTFFDISKINASLYLNTTPANGLNNASNHYSNSSCTLYNGLGNNIDFRCSFNVEYYANNGTWLCNATAIDTLNATNTSRAETNVRELIAIGITPDIISFGNMEILQISPNDIIVNITNYGNIKLDFSLYGYAIIENDNLSMDCAKGNISMEYEKFSTSAGQGYNLMTPINNTLNPVFIDLNLSKREGGGIVSKKSVYWKLQIPERISGTCNGRLVFMAVNN